MPLCLLLECLFLCKIFEIIINNNNNFLNLFEISWSRGRAQGFGSGGRSFESCKGGYSLATYLYHHTVRIFVRNTGSSRRPF